MKYRISTWMDTTQKCPVYGIECQTVKGAKYRNLAEDGKPLFFNSEEEAVLKIKKLKKET